MALLKLQELSWLVLEDTPFPDRWLILKAGLLALLHCLTVLVSFSLEGVALLVLMCMSTAWLSPLLYVAAVVTRRKLRRDILGESNTGSNLCAVSKSRASEE